MSFSSINGSNLRALATHHTIPAAPFTTTITTFISPKSFVSISPKLTPFSLIPLPLPSPSRPRILRPSASSAAAEALETTTVGAEQNPQDKEKKLSVVVKGPEKPKLVLRFIWMEKNIGLSLDQAIPGHGTIPLSPYYWWPRKDAWEELKSKLEEKPWISQKRMIILLNQATDIINLWQQSGGANL